MSHTGCSSNFGVSARAGGEEWLRWMPYLAQVIRWLSTAAGEIRQGPENARLYYLFGAANISIEQATQKANSRHRSAGARAIVTVAGDSPSDRRYLPSIITCGGDGKIQSRCLPTGVPLPGSGRLSSCRVTFPDGGAIEALRAAGNALRNPLSRKIWQDLKVCVVCLSSQEIF